MRTLWTPGARLDYALPSREWFGVQRFLEKRGSGLAAVSFLPAENLRRVVWGPRGWVHTAAQWLGRCGRWFHVGKRWLLMRLQSEQGLVSLRKTLSPAYSWRRLPRAGVSWTLAQVKGSGVLDPGEKAVRTRGGWLGYRGDRRMVAACGYAWPDPGARTVFRVERTLGFPAQVLAAARWTRRRLDEFTARLREDGSSHPHCRTGKRPHHSGAVLFPPVQPARSTWIFG